MNLKPLDFKILSELMKNAKISDRQMARRLKVSQPTVTRRRAKLEKELLLRYTTIPNWRNLGFGIISLTFIKWKFKEFPDEMLIEARNWCTKQPNILFAATGQGSRANRVCLSIHRTYRAYSRFLQEVRQKWGKFSENIHSFVISIGEDTVLQPLTLEHLADSLKAEKT